MENEVLEILKSMQLDIKSLNTKVDRIENKLDKVYDQTAILTEFKNTTENSLSNISENIEFITDKLNKNEREIFTLKNKLPIK